VVGEGNHGAVAPRTVVGWTCGVEIAVTKKATDDPQRQDSRMRRDELRQR
jgi:hypothetical protein